MSIASMPVMQAPDQLLQQALYGQVPDIEPYQALAELNKRVKTKQMSMAQMGNQAIGQARGMQQQPPVAQQLMQANQQLDNGIAALGTPTTQAFNAGGIVAFSGGDMVPSAPTTGYDDIYMRARAYGINLSPYDSPEDRASKIQRMKVMDEYMKNGRTTAQIPQPPPNLPAPPTMQPPAFSVPIPDVNIQEPMAPPPAMGGNIARAGSARPVGGIGGGAPAFKPGTAPEYNPKAAKYQSAGEVTPEEIQAQIDKGVAPKMAAYAAKMEKYSQYAQAMQRGETVPKTSAMQRGFGAFLEGASDEVNSARRAGVRPSLGLALGAAGSGAIKQDRAYQERLAAAKEKGMEAEMNMEKARLAYEAGQTELANKYYIAARQSKKESLDVLNKGMESERADEAAKFGFKFEDYKAREAARERAAEGAANRANNLAIANIRADTSLETAGIRAAGGAGGKGSLNPQRMAELKRKAEVDVDKSLEKDINYMRMSIKDPVGASNYRNQKLSERLQRILIDEEGVTIPTAPGATPGVSPSRTIDFNSIK
jgi:hypothetical protein